MKISLVVFEMFHLDGRRTEGRIDMPTLAVAFRNFTNAPNRRHTM